MCLLVYKMNSYIIIKMMQSKVRLKFRSKFSISKYIFLNKISLKNKIISLNDLYISKRKINLFIFLFLISLSLYEIKKLNKFFLLMINLY